jgi:hypothetical protein
LRDNYATQFRSYESNLNQSFKDLFGPFEATLKPAAEQELQRFPHTVRNKPETKLLAYGLASMRILSKKLSDSNIALAAARTNAAGAVVAGPTAAAVTTAPPAKTPYYSAAEEKEIRSRFQF